MMTLRDILMAKGSTVYTIEPDATLLEVARELVHYNVGSLIVSKRDPSEGEKILGIVTERDILRASAMGHGPLGEVRVYEVMSRHVITASPDDHVETIMGQMTRSRVRHLPVLSEGRLVGVVSIGDVVKIQHDRLAMENQFMKDYIRG